MFYNSVMSTSLTSSNRAKHVSVVYWVVYFDGVTVDSRLGIGRYDNVVLYFPHIFSNIVLPNT